MPPAATGSAPTAYRLVATAARPASAIVIDSPHSFRHWPADATPTIAPEAALRRLPVDEVRRRIKTLYDPYHAALPGLIDAGHAERGFSCHIDCHSMKSVGNAMNDHDVRPRPDIVVGHPSV